jgi:hypothetical protein
MKILTVDYSDHCSLFYADVEKKAVFWLLNYIFTLKDCNDKVIFKLSCWKKARKRIFKLPMEALNDAFKSGIWLEL